MGSFLIFRSKWIQGVVIAILAGQVPVLVEAKNSGYCAGLFQAAIPSAGERSADRQGILRSAGVRNFRRIFGLDTSSKSNSKHVYLIDTSKGPQVSTTIDDIPVSKILARAILSENFDFQQIEFNKSQYQKKVSLNEAFTEKMSAEKKVLTETLLSRKFSEEQWNQIVAIHNIDISLKNGSTIGNYSFSEIRAMAKRLRVLKDLKLSFQDIRLLVEYGIVGEIPREVRDQQDLLKLAEIMERITASPEQALDLEKKLRLIEEALKLAEKGSIGRILTLHLIELKTKYTSILDHQNSNILNYLMESEANFAIGKLKEQLDKLRQSSESKLEESLRQVMASFILKPDEDPAKLTAQFALPILEKEINKATHFLQGLDYLEKQSMMDKWKIYKFKLATQHYLDIMMDVRKNKKVAAQILPNHTNETSNTENITIGEPGFSPYSPDRLYGELERLKRSSTREIEETVQRVMASFLSIEPNEDSTKLEATDWHTLRREVIKAARLLKTLDYLDYNRMMDGNKIYKTRLVTKHYLKTMDTAFKNKQVALKILRGEKLREKTLREMPDAQITKVNTENLSQLIKTITDFEMDLKSNMNDLVKMLASRLPIPRYIKSRNEEPISPEIVVNDYMVNHKFRYEEDEKLLLPEELSRYENFTSAIRFVEKLSSVLKILEENPLSNSQEHYDRFIAEVSEGIQNLQISKWDKQIEDHFENTIEKYAFDALFTHPRIEIRGPNDIQNALDFQNTLGAREKQAKLLFKYQYLRKFRTDSDELIGSYGDFYGSYLNRLSKSINQSIGLVTEGKEFIEIIASPTWEELLLIDKILRTLFWTTNKWDKTAALAQFLVIGRSTVVSKFIWKMYSFEESTNSFVNNETRKKWLLKDIYVEYKANDFVKSIYGNFYKFVKDMIVNPIKKAQYGHEHLRLLDSHINLLWQLVYMHDNKNEEFLKLLNRLIEIKGLLNRFPTARVNVIEPLVFGKRGAPPEIPKWLGIGAPPELPN